MCLLNDYSLATYFCLWTRWILFHFYSNHECTKVKFSILNIFGSYIINVIFFRCPGCTNQFTTVPLNTTMSINNHPTSTSRTNHHTKIIIVLLCIGIRYKCKKDSIPPHLAWSVTCKQKTTSYQNKKSFKYLYKDQILKFSKYSKEDFKR